MSTMDISTTPKRDRDDDQSLGIQQSRDETEGGQNQIAEATQECEDTTYQPDINDRPESEVQCWIYSATSVEQRRKRFYAVLHSTYPSNDEFSQRLPPPDAQKQATNYLAPDAARHPFYDPEEDGPYDEFIKHEMDDDGYGPHTDPSRSTEVWQPKIGDEGIENEVDLRMVLRARKEHRARSRRFRRRRILFIKSQRDAGVDYADIDMTQVLVGPDNIPGYYDSSDDDSDDGEEVVEAPKATVETETRLATTSSQAVETRVFDAQETGSPCRRPRGRPRGGKGKKRRVSYKRKRGTKKENPNGTYHYDPDSEDEKPARKKRRKVEWATSGADASNEPWRVQTRSVARRNGPMGMDGNCDLNDDDERSIVTGSRINYQSKSGDNTAKSIVESHATEKNGGSGLRERRGLLSRITSFITGC